MGMSLEPDTENTSRGFAEVEGGSPGGNHEEFEGEDAFDADDEQDVKQEGDDVSVHPQHFHLKLIISPRMHQSHVPSSLPNSAILSRQWQQGLAESLMLSALNPESLPWIQSNRLMGQLGGEPASWQHYQCAATSATSHLL